MPDTDTAVIVVDESVLALANYKLADPLSYFYAERSENVNDYHLREKVSLANPELVKAGVTFRQIQSLPINGRNLQNFMALSDGVNASSVMRDCERDQRY